MTKYYLVCPRVKTETLHYLRKELYPLKPFPMHLGEDKDPLAYLRFLVNELIDKNVLVRSIAKCINTAVYTNLLIERAKLGDENFVYRFLIRKNSLKKLYDEIIPNCQDKDDGHARVFRIGLLRKGCKRAFVTLDKNVDEFIASQQCNTKIPYHLFTSKYV